MSCAEAGERLVSSNHYAAEEVQEKVRDLFPMILVILVNTCDVCTFSTTVVYLQVLQTLVILVRYKHL